MERMWEWYQYFLVMFLLWDIYKYANLLHLKESSTMKHGYSEEGRVFMFENTPTVVKLAGIHLERINKVRRITDWMIVWLTMDVYHTRIVWAMVKKRKCPEPGTKYLELLVILRPGSGAVLDSQIILEIQTVDMQSGDHWIMLNYALYWRTGFLICDIFFYLMILRFSD